MSCGVSPKSATAKTSACRTRSRQRNRSGIVVTLIAAYCVACLYFQRTNPQPTLNTASATAFAPAWPEEFLWGVATAAHQVEGGNIHNDWWRFEHLPGKIAHGDTSGATADHWHRVAEDIGLMKSLGANAYRFSLERSRLQPVEGQWDDAAWTHYAEELTALRAAGQEPVVTLLHFTLPAWIADRGGVTATDFPERFARFTAEAVKRLGTQVKWWCTVNEPQVQMYNGYVSGYWPPAVKDNALAVKAFAGLLKAHAAAAAVLRGQDPDAYIGVASSMIWFEPANRWNVLEWVVSNTVAEGFNWAFYESIKKGRMEFRMPGFPKLFEWAEGYGWRFGLYRLDLKTLARTPAPGVEEFKRLAPPP